VFFLILIVGMERKQQLKILGELIRKRRININLTQYQLAERSNVDRNYIGMLERGERNPSYLTLLKISHGLNLPLSEILKLK